MYLIQITIYLLKFKKYNDFFKDIMATIRTHYPQTVIGSSKKNKERSNLPVTLNDGTLKNKKTINCVFSDREVLLFYICLIKLYFLKF